MASKHTPEPTFKGVDAFGTDISMTRTDGGSVFIMRQNDDDTTSTMSFCHGTALRFSAWTLGISKADPAKAIADAREKVNAAMEECIMEHMDMTAEKLRSALASLGGVA